MNNPQNLLIIKKSSLFIRRKNKFSVLIWNIYKAKKKGFIIDFASFIQNNDLLLLQEYSARDEINDIVKKSHKETIMAISFLNKQKIATGVCTISSMQSYKNNSIISSVKEPISNTPKSVLITRYHLKKDLTVINVHGINFVADSKFLIHMKQIDEYIKDCNGSIIMAGDFNTWNKTRISILLEIAQNNGLIQLEFLNDNRRLKLDRVFVRDCNTQNHEILKHITTSDHKPLYFEFSL